MDFLNFSQSSAASDVQEKKSFLGKKEADELSFNEDEFLMGMHIEGDDDDYSPEQQLENLKMSNSSASDSSGDEYYVNKNLQNLSPELGDDEYELLHGAKK
jgi:hypothetical protein